MDYLTSSVKVVNFLKAVRLSLSVSTCFVFLIFCIHDARSVLKRRFLISMRFFFYLDK